MVIRDDSNGYDAIAEEFIRTRGSNGDIGVSTVRKWAQALPPRATVLDLGCGTGFPISKTLMDQGLMVYAIDGSPKMIAEFRQRFPNVPVECSGVEASRFFDRQFDGVVAWGLIFLLTQESQRVLIKKVAHALIPNGRFLFTAPKPAADWIDNLTGRRSYSLGADMYRKILQDEGFQLLGEDTDEGDNHYYLASKA